MAKSGFQERLIFFPEILDHDYKFGFKDFQEKWIHCEEIKLHSLLFPSPGSPRLILFFHGNAGSLASWGELAQQLRDRLHINVWMLDYPGYGKSEGRILSEAQLLKAARAFFDQARAEFPALSIILHGRSIGCGPAAWLATQFSSDALILETPFFSFRRLARELAPWFPGFLHKYKFPVAEWLAKYSKPLLILHGSRDEIIPFQHSLDIKNQNPAATLVTVEGGSHNDLSNFESYWPAIDAFLGSFPS